MVNSLSENGKKDEVRDSLKILESASWAGLDCCVARHVQNDKACNRENDDDHHFLQQNTYSHLLYMTVRLMESDVPSNEETLADSLLDDMNLVMQSMGSQQE